MRPRVFALPEGPPLQLSLTPRLESWERHDHPAQAALREFVAHVRELVDPVIERTRGELAVRLDVGLPHAVDPLWERDLDNYLFPIARVMPERVVSVWATKRRDPQSFVRVERAAELTAPAGWQRFEVPRAPGSERYWKAAVRRAVSGAEELAAGPVGLQLALAVGPERNWTGMWKASIDGLEPLLGKTYEDRIWNPQDGRVVRLGLHRTVDYSLGHDASMTLWARPGDEGWPELRWLAQMEPDERELLLRARQPRPSVMPKPAVATSGERHRAGQPRTAETVEAGDHETVEIFRDDDDGYLAWVGSRPTGFVVNIQRSGNPSDARLHRTTCRTVSGVNPRRGPWTGAYVKACSADLASLDAWALEHVGSPITRCGTCQPPQARRRHVNIPSDPPGR
jgi:hypothetical protein